MTEPGRADASRTRIAGVVLLAVAGVAAVVGLLALGGEGPPSHEAAPTSSPPVALPGLTSSTGPTPGPPPDAVQPGQPGRLEAAGRRWARRSCRAPAPVVAAMWVVCRPSLGPSPVLLPAVCPPSPPVGPPSPVAAMRVACRLLPAVLPVPPVGCPAHRRAAGRRRACRPGPALPPVARIRGACSPAPGPPPVAPPVARAPSVVCPAGRPAHRRAAGRRWSPRSSQAPFPVAAARVACRLVPFPLVLPAVRPVPPQSRSACTTTR